MSSKEMVNKNNFQVLSELKESGQLNDLVRRGIIPLEYLDHINIYQTFLKYLNEGNGIYESYKIAGTIHGVHFNTVKYIRNKMES